MRLIDADALNHVRVRIYHDDETIGGYNAVVPSSEIRNAPTVDAIPVIRCEDCKYCRTYYHGENMPFSYACGKLYLTKNLSSDDYCSRAERKEE